MRPNYGLQMIEKLRQEEEILLYDNILTISEQDSLALKAFLQAEYAQESLEYPYKVPIFDADAAVWAAKTIYIAAQLLLYRENKEKDLAALLPTFSGEYTPSAILSVDLSMRFLPDILQQLKLIDSEDALIPLLEKLLYDWHYSAVNYPLEIEKIAFDTFPKQDCLQQLYANRIIAHKNLHLAKHPLFHSWIQANLGMYANDFWKELRIMKE